LLPAAFFAAILLCASGCAHSRWSAKTLADGVPIAASPVVGTVVELRALPRPQGVDAFNATRVSQERVVYRLRAVLLRFTLASDGDIHLAIAQPGEPAATVIAEIPDPARMTGAPDRYRNQVTQARRGFIQTFGTPTNVWKEVDRAVVLTGPIFYDYRHGQVGGKFAGAESGIEIHPVLSIAPAGKT
jgi:hypothetical protein